MAILKAADKDLVTCLCDCALNILNGNININSEKKEKLVPYKHLLRALANKNGCWKSKRKTLIQKGGNFIPLLLGPILSAVLSFVLE